MLKADSCADHKPQQSRSAVCHTSSNLMKIKGGCILPPNKQSHRSSSGQMLVPKRAASECHLQEKQHQRLKYCQNAQINVLSICPRKSSKFSDSSSNLHKGPTILRHRVTHYERCRFLHVYRNKSLLLTIQTFPDFRLDFSISA